MNGKIKCNEKNRFSVALLIEYSPQIHSIIVVSIYVNTRTQRYNGMYPMYMKEILNIRYCFICNQS